MTFILIFSALAVCTAELTGSNAQSASNPRKIYAALAAVQSDTDEAPIPAPHFMSISETKTLNRATRTSLPGESSKES
jgi:hypothetical protein